MSNIDWITIALAMMNIFTIGWNYQMWNKLAELEKANRLRELVHKINYGVPYFDVNDMRNEMKEEFFQ